MSDDCVAHKTITRWSIVLIVKGIASSSNELRGPVQEIETQSKSGFDKRFDYKSP